jgi:hypothetical protein
LSHFSIKSRLFSIRNWAYHWGEEGAGSDSCSETYRGPEAFSEIEARNVRDFILKQNNMVKAHRINRRNATFLKGQCHEIFLL